jgi:hypothetical protein
MADRFGRVQVLFQGITQAVAVSALEARKQDRQKTGRPCEG